MPQRREWFLVMTQPREEIRALQNLEAQEIPCCLPRMRRERLIRGVPRITIEPLFPRYVFAAWNWESGASAKVRSTRGVTSLVRFGLEPARVPRDLVEAFLTIESLRGDAGLEPLFQAGQPVRVLEGVFRDFEGIYETLLPDDRVVVLIEFLARKVRLPLPAAAIAAT